METTKVYIIAEVGQNHNGDMETARRLIDLVSMPIYDTAFGRDLRPVDAVKFTKRDMAEEMTVEEYQRPYDSPHAYGRTYGEHRERLELSYEAHAELGRYAKAKGLDFVETLCSPRTVRLLEMVTVDRIKVASRDITNIPLLERIAEVGKPVILSAGMCSQEDLDAAIGIISRRHSAISILHCVSEYPADYPHLNLNVIAGLIQRYGDRFTIGYSDHSIGIMAPVLAVGVGARIIEKHVTLSRMMKGSDHKGSLEMDGIWRLTRDLRNAEMCFDRHEVSVNPAVEGSRRKLQRSLASRVAIAAGQVVREADLTMLSPGEGLTWDERSHIVGRRAVRAIPAGTHIRREDFQSPG